MLKENGGTSGEVHRIASVQGLNKEKGIPENKYVCTEPVSWLWEKGVPSVSAARAQKFSDVRCVREGAKGRVCKQELERTGGMERGKRNAVCARETELRGLASWSEGGVCKTARGQICAKL